MARTSVSDGASTNSDARILIVDDDPLMLELLAEMLGEYSQLRTATTGLEALRMARETPPDLVLLDVGLPDLDGFRVCEMLRADPRLKEAPVIFVTGERHTTAAVSAFKAGGNDFLTKPFSSALLLQRVREQLRR